MTINVGILGFAHGHVKAYMIQWRDNEGMGVRVVAGWDHDAERAAKAGTDFDIEISESLDHLLEREGLDAVVIASETSMHADLVEKAASAGKAIVLQKPMALTLEEADRIVAATENVPFTMAWQMRVDPQNLKMKELIKEDTIGKVLMVRRRHGLAAHTWPWILDSWHIDPRHNRDMWADDAAHAIDFIYWLLGMPKSVTAEIDTLVNPKMPNDNGIAIYRYPDGPIAEVSCSFTCIAGENTTEIIGEKGVIIQNYGDAPSAGSQPKEGGVGLKWRLQGDKDWTISDIPSPRGHGERIGGLAGPIAEFLQSQRGPIATAREGRDALKMVLACYGSSERGERVSLS